MIFFVLYIFYYYLLNDWFEREKKSIRLISQRSTEQLESPVTCVWEVLRCLQELQHPLGRFLDECLNKHNQFIEPQKSSEKNLRPLENVIQMLTHITVGLRQTSSPTLPPRSAARKLGVWPFRSANLRVQRTCKSTLKMSFLLMSREGFPGQTTSRLKPDYSSLKTSKFFETLNLENLNLKLFQKNFSPILKTKHFTPPRKWNRKHNLDSQGSPTGTFGRDHDHLAEIMIMGQQCPTTWVTARYLNVPLSSLWSPAQV